MALLMAKVGKAQACVNKKVQVFLDWECSEPGRKFVSWVEDGKRDRGWLMV